MSFVATAIVGSAVVAGGSSLLASRSASSAASDAARTQADANQRALDAQLEMYYQSREDTAPWRTAGESALNTLMGTSATQQPVQQQNSLASNIANTATGAVSGMASGLGGGGIMGGVNAMNSVRNQGVSTSGQQPIQQTQQPVQQYQQGLPQSQTERYGPLGFENPEYIPPQQVQPQQVQEPGPVTSPGQQVGDFIPEPATPGLIEGPQVPYDGQTPTNILNQGFTPGGNTQSMSDYMQQNPMEYRGQDPTDMLNAGFQYSGRNTPTDLIDQGFQYSGPDPTGSLNALLRYRPEEFVFEKDAGYEFRLGEGQQAIDRIGNAGGRSLPGSGRAQKELLRYNQGFASNEYDRAYGRYDTDRVRDLQELTQKYNANSADYNRERMAFMDKYNMTAQDYDRQFGQYITNIGMVSDDRARQAGEYNNALNQNNQAYQQDYGRYMDNYNMRNQDYSNYYGRYQDKVNRYMNMAGVGQQIASQNSQNANQMGSNMANNAMATGNALAQGQMNAGNAQAAGYMGIGNALNQGIGNYLTYNMMNQNRGGITPAGRGTTYPIQNPTGWWQNN